MKSSIEQCPICRMSPLVGQLEPGNGRGTTRKFTVYCNGTEPFHELSIELVGKKVAINAWNSMVRALNKPEGKQ